MDLSSRGYGNPSKRLPISAGRLQTGSFGGHGDGHRTNGNRNMMQFVLNGRNNARANKAECFSCGGKSILYRVIFMVIVLCFVAIVVMQGSFVNVSKHTELENTLSNATSEQSLSWTDVDGSQYLYRKPSDRLSRLRQRLKVEQLRQKKWHSIRRPQLALVCPHVGVGPDSLLLLTLAKAYQALDYNLVVYAMRGGSLRPTWEKMDIVVNIVEFHFIRGPLVDWSKFDGVIAISQFSKWAISSLMQDPFKAMPVLWIIQDSSMLKYLSADVSTKVSRDWMHAFERADAVIFPTDALQNAYGQFDTGNFHVIPGSPIEVWETEQYMRQQERILLRADLNLSTGDFVILVAGSSMTVKGTWKAHAMVMRAVYEATSKARIGSVDKRGRFKIFVLGHGSSRNGYDVALKTMAAHFGLWNGSVQHVGINEEVNKFLWVADMVVYASVNEETSFPPILVRAMSFGRPIVVPSFKIIEKHITDGVNGLLFPPEDYEFLGQILSEKHKPGTLDAVASEGRIYARNMLAFEAIVGYSELLESILQFPSEVSLPKPIDETLAPMRIGWDWDIFQSKDVNEGDRLNFQLEMEMWNASSNNADSDGTAMSAKEYEDAWEEEMDEEIAIEMLDELDRVEEEELEERKEQVQGNFEDVNRGVKRAEKEKTELREREDGELERTGQPLCIYEPYLGPGAWPFLHQNNLIYRGLSLSPRGRRPKFDDVDAAVRLPLLNSSYYRDVFCEFGAFLAIGNRLDRVHKNSWIGFQPWLAAGRNVALSVKAEEVLVDLLKTGKDGDAVYFWAPINMDNNGESQDDIFWSFCDARNGGNCRSIFLEAFKEMYDLPDSWDELPPMPSRGYSWSSMHCWIMPTSSFMEFVLFSRMFIDALDALYYREHHDNGRCPLASSTLETQHCYCRLLDTLVNIWAYHSARKLILIDPNTGLTNEQHPLRTRRGHMWIKWFGINILKGMDEDMAEKADADRSNERWLWPQTGEVFWQGILERERQERYKLKLERKQKNRERLARMRSRYKQKALGRYVKPAPGAGYVPVEPEPINNGTKSLE